MLSAQLLRDVIERVDRLVANDRLLDCGEGLERRKQRARMCRAAHVLDKVAKLLGKREQHLVLIVDGLCNSGRDAQGA
eukprot:jgi/Chrpa1/14778/Chrysochromulina_OHIO_Genome00020852-RA